MKWAHKIHLSGVEHLCILSAVYRLLNSKSIAHPDSTCNPVTELESNWDRFS